MKASPLWGNTEAVEIPIGGWAKSYNLGGTFLPLLIANMEITLIIGWPKRASYGDSGVENDVFESSLLAGFGTEFPCF